MTDEPASPRLVDAEGNPTPDQPWIFRTYAGPLERARVERAVPRQPRRGPDRPVDRVRSADPVRLRLGPPDRAARGRQGRRADQLARRLRTCCSTASRSSEMNTSMTINGTAMWLLALYVALARERGVAARRAARARPRTTSSRSTWRAARTSSRPRPACGSSPRCTSTASTRSRSGTRRTSAATTCRRPARRRRRSSRSRSPTRSACSTCCASAGRFDDDAVRARASGASRSSSTPASGSSRRCARCARSRELWDEITPRALRRHRPEATACSATACRSTRSASPRSSPRTTPGASCIEALGVTLSAATRAAARCSCRRGTRRCRCRGRGTSSGRCACSRSSPTRPTCSSTPTCSTAARWSRAKVAELKDAGARPRSTRILGDGRRAAPRSRPAT